MGYHPWYNTSANYQTNAKSIVDYLARSNKFLEMMIEDYEVFQETIVAEMKQAKFDAEMSVEDILLNWVEDGTLERIINDEVFENKADKDYVSYQLDLLEENISNDLKNSIDQTVTKIDDLAVDLKNRKKEKSTGLIYLSDYNKMEGETDDQLINRVLATITKREDGFREGTLVLESKDYMLSDSIVLGQYQGLQGAGHGTKLKLEDSTKPIIQLTNNLDDSSLSTYGVSIKDIALWGSYANIGIKMKAASHLSIRDVYIYNTRKGIEAEGIWLGHYDRVTIRNYDTMGEYGFHITGGVNRNVTSTSLLFDNTWVKNFKRGYDIGMALYSSFNSTACDTFTHFAYNGGSAVTYNSVGAEDGHLIDGGSVFKAGARPVVYNTPNIMYITYEGNGEAYIFDFENTSAEINGFRWQAGPLTEKLKYIHLGEISQVNLSNSHFPTPLLGKDRFRWGHQNSNILERSYSKIEHYDLNRTNILSDLSSQS